MSSNASNQAWKQLSFIAPCKLMPVMKLTAVLLISAVVNVHATAYAQKVTIKGKDISLEKIFENIKEQTGFSFIYAKEQLREASPVSLDVKNEDLNRVLKECFAHQPLTFTINDKIIVVKHKLFVPSSQVARLPYVVVDGLVKDSATKQTLAGVTIKVKGRDIGTVTDAQGKFSLEVPENAVLEVSYLGYTSKQVSTVGNGVINILLSAATTGLDQLVVVGYGAIKKVDLTGAISTVDKKMLENRPVSNALNALQGTAPGLVITRNNGQPGKEGWSANIRGYSSLNGTNSPLVIIDGVEGDLSSLNPDDIASISVLKDAAAAIYGAKSSGGVIIVTTKKGSSNRIKLSYTGIYSSNSFYGIPQRLHSWQEGMMANISRENAGLPDAYTQQQLNWMKNPDSSFIQHAQDPSQNGYYYDLDQTSLILRKSTSSENHNLSMSGGNNETQYFVSMGYYTEDGIFKFGPDGTKRYNARLNLTTRFNNIFSLDSRISFIQSETKSPSSDVDGDYGLLYNIYQLRTMWPIFLPGSDDTKYSPTGTGAKTYATLKDGGYDKSIKNELNGIFTLNVEHLLPSLKFRAVYSPRLQQYNDDNFARTIPLWTYDNAGNSEIAKYYNEPNNVTKTRQTVLAHDVQLLADYDWSVATDQHIHFLGGFEYQFYKYDQVVASQANLISNETPSLNLQASATIPPTVQDDIQTNAWISYFGRINYDFKEKYFIEATIRNDASSKLAPGHRSQTFPAISAGWDMSKEVWFNNALPFVNELKIRGSWGEQGNAQLGENYQNNYNYIAVLKQGDAYPFNNVSNPSVYQSELPSTSLGWETVKQTDGGIDIALYNNRLVGSLDFFVRNNNNMLIALNEPSVLGVTPSTTNAASMRTWGWGFNIGWRDKIKEVGYYINCNLADNKNKITRYLGNVVIEEGLNQAVPGYSINSIFGYSAQGYFQTEDDVTDHAFQDNRTGPGDIKYEDVNGDNRINQGNNTLSNHGDLVYLGNVSPRYNFGITMGLNWNGFDFSCFLQGTGKRSIMLYSKSIVPFVESWRQPWKINTDYWTPTNPAARFPRLYQGGTQNTLVSSHWVQNSAYVRLKNLQIGYTFPVKLTERINVAKARIFFTGENLFTATKMWYKYYDPEDPNNVSFNYPFYHSYAVGINLDF